TLSANELEIDTPAIAQHILGGDAAAGIPPRSLPAACLFVDGAEPARVVMGAGALDMSAGPALLCRVRQSDARRIILNRPPSRIIGIGPCPEAPWIEGARRDICAALDHPLREGPSSTRAPGDTDCRAAGQPIIPESGCRTEDHGAVGRICDPSVDDPLDASVS